MREQSGQPHTAPQGQSLEARNGSTHLPSLCDLIPDQLSPGLGSVSVSDDADHGDETSVLENKEPGVLRQTEKPPVRTGHRKRRKQSYEARKASIRQRMAKRRQYLLENETEEQKQMRLERERMLRARRYERETSEQKEIRRAALRAKSARYKKREQDKLKKIRLASERERLALERESLGKERQKKLEEKIQITSAKRKGQRAMARELETSQQREFRLAVDRARRARARFLKSFTNNTHDDQAELSHQTAGTMGHQAAVAIKREPSDPGLNDRSIDQESSPGDDEQVMPSVVKVEIDVAEEPGIMHSIEHSHEPSSDQAVAHDTQVKRPAPRDWLNYQPTTVIWQPV